MRNLRLGSLATLVAACSIILHLVEPAALSGQRANVTPAVLVQPVTERQHADEIEALGTLLANESVTITAPVAERLASVHFEDGQIVEAGKVLARLEADEEAAALAEATSTLTEATRQWERLQELAASSFVSQADLDEARRNFEAARARAGALEARLRDRTIVAPFAGRVGLRQVSPGSFVTAGQPITTLDDLQRMKLDCAVPETFLPVLREGASIVARSRALGGREFVGTIASVDTRIDPVTRAVTVRAEFENPDLALRPGLLITVRILKDERTSVFVPESSLVQVGRQVFVYVSEGSGAEMVARRRPIRIGARIPGWVEVLEGLRVGEPLIVEGAFNLRPGQKVKPVTAAQMGAAAPR